MKYPESSMKVAAHIGNGVVGIYNHEHNGFRPLIIKINEETKPKAIEFCTKFNNVERAYNLTKIFVA